MTEPIDHPLHPKEDITGPKLPPQGPQEVPDEVPSRTFPGVGEDATGQTTPTDMPSPMEVANSQAGGGQVQVTPDTLNDGIDRLNQKVDVLKTEVTPQRYDELSDAQKVLLHTKLGQFSNSIEGLSKRLGVPYTKPKSKGLLDDAKTVLSWLTEGQNQLNSVAGNLAKKTPGEISVVSMLRAQAQLLAADRAINFASALVAKGADFITKIMQTQL